MICPGCGKPMINLGNTSGVVYASLPPQWDETLVCQGCKTKKTIRVKGVTAEQIDLSQYRELG